MRVGHPAIFARCIHNGIGYSIEELATNKRATFPSLFDVCYFWVVGPVAVISTG